MLGQGDLCLEDLADVLRCIVKAMIPTELRVMAP